MFSRVQCQNCNCIWWSRHLKNRICPFCGSKQVGWVNHYHVNFENDDKKI